MDIAKRLALSYYKTIAVLDAPHQVSLVQHQDTRKIYVKKILQVYHLPVYEYLAAHPIFGVPRIIDYMEEQNQLTVIEEYISGDTLQSKLDDHAITIDAARHYMLELCDILQQLHSLDPPVVHRDIKPSNIMITSCDHVVLLDFNAAKYYTENADSDTTLLGTQGYAAPEQYGFGSSSPRTDIYAVGVLLQEICHILPDAASAFAQIAEKCMHMDPKDRFSSVAELKTALLCTDSHAGSALQGAAAAATKTATGKRAFLPPGFRTGVLWKKILAAISYTFLIWLSLTIVIRDVAGNNLAAGPQWLERIFLLLMGLAVICFTCDYLHIQRVFHLDRIKQPVLRWLCIVGIDTGILFVLLLFMIVSESLLFHG